MNEEWYDVFLDTLYKKYPKKNQLVDALMDILCIEREAVYRRLRKHVMFPANEIIKIASVCNISLDKITNVDGGKINFLMHQVNYTEPSEYDVQYLRNNVKLLKGLGTSSKSEFMAICNKLPRSLNAGFPSLYRFFLFKWEYQYGNSGVTIPYSQINIPESIRQISSDFYTSMRYIANTDYVFDHNMLDYFVGDIRYFHSIHLISDSEKELIKKDLHTLLNYLSNIAGYGCFPETKNKVNIYISQINIDTNYSCFCDENMKTFRIHVFNKYEMQTYDDATVSKFRNWMQLKKRAAIQISVTDEKSRIDFFRNQNQLVDSL